MIYCQNKLCPFYKKSRKYVNYGKCSQKEVFMTLQMDDEYEYSKQPRKYV